MSRLQCDIRRLLRHFRRRILEWMKQQSSTGLEVCLVCGQDFVSMARCTRSGDGTWSLLLRCGACGTWHETFADDEAVAALWKAIKRGLRTVADGLDELDLIGPDDFQSAGDAPA
jgi:hypothetical protein